MGVVEQDMSLNEFAVLQLHVMKLCYVVLKSIHILLTLFWTGVGGANLPPPAGFLNIAQKPFGLGS